MKLYKSHFFSLFVSRLLFLIGLQCLFLGSVYAESCQLSNVFLDAMPKGELKITNSTSDTLTLQVKTAQNDRTRSAGFQRVCAETIAAEPILFVFDQSRIPSFHMFNVVAPIDIAFIDNEGRVESIQSMFPYVVMSNNRPLYSPQREVIAALEVRPGFFKDHDIEVGDLVEWQLLDSNP